MRMSWVIAGIVGCTGEPERKIPSYDDVEVEGDCADDTLYQEFVGSTLLWLHDIGNEDGSLPDGPGRIITEAVAFGDLLFELELESPDWPLVDFDLNQVAVVWLEACQVDLQTTEVLRKTDDTFVFDVDLLDRTKNCHVECEGLSQALLISSFTNEVPATLCRRVHAGCAP